MPLLISTMFGRVLFMIPFAIVTWLYGWFVPCGAICGSPGYRRIPDRLELLHAQARL